MHPAVIIYVSVKLACERLTDLELASLNIALQCSIDARPVIGYSKVKHLFTEEGGTRMHEETIRAFAQVALERLSPKDETA